MSNIHMYTLLTSSFEGIKEIALASQTRGLWNRLSEFEGNFWSLKSEPETIKILDADSDNRLWLHLLIDY